MPIEIKILDESLFAEFGDLKYQTKGSAGIDLRAAETVRLEPGEAKKVKTGIALRIGQEGIAGLILPRSGLGHSGLVLGNLVGLIDSDYEDEVLVSAWNRRPTNTHMGHIVLERGQRFAQLIFIEVFKTHYINASLYEDKVGKRTGGFGSTGNE